MNKPAQLVAGATVSVLLVRTIKPGCEQAFWALEQEIEAELARVPGFLTVNHFPTRQGEEGEYLTVLQFDSVDSLVSWERSDARQRFLERAQDLVVGDIRRKHISGLEGLFEGSASRHPPRYKMVLVLVAVIYSMIVLLRPPVLWALGALPELLQTLVLVAVQVSLMTYLVMPWVTRRLSGWLYRH